jgi:imidazolonepropionase-like amidohydrolase
MRKRVHYLFLALSIYCLVAVTCGAEERILIRAEHIYSSQGVWGEPGEILVKDGKISFVGDSIELELPAEVIEVDSVMPGIVNAYSMAGLAGGDSEVSREVTPEFDTFSAVDFDDRRFAEILDAGVTTVQILPGTESVFAGLACIVKTAGESAERELNRASSLVIANSSDPTSRNRSRSRPDGIYVRQPTNRMGVVWIIRNSLHQTQNGKQLTGLDPNTTTVLNDMLSGKLPTICVSRADFDIRSALDLGNEFGFKPIIYGGDEVYRIFDEFKERNGKLVYTALTASTGTLSGPEERTDLRWNVPGKLAEANIDFCIAGDELLEQARFAVRFGLEPKLALEAITARPAEMIGQAARIGTIEVGKDADLVAFNGAPLKPTSGIEWTMVSGKIYGNDKSE